jgi:lipid A disaccharide synthetase
MGFIEVIFNLKNILGIKICKRDVLKFQPDVIIFIDYPVLICDSKMGKEIGIKLIITYHLKFGLGKKIASKKLSVT